MYKLSNWKNSLLLILNILFSSVLGVGIVLFAIIPSFLAIIESGKASSSIGNTISLFYWPQNVLEHLRTLIAPIDSTRYHSFFDASSFSSTGMYLPIFGFVFVIQRCFRRRDWLSKLTIFLVICYIFPFTNAVFNLFSNVLYTRWLYGFVLIISLISILEIEYIMDKRINIDKKAIMIVTLISIVLTILPCLAYLLYKKELKLLIFLRMFVQPLHLLDTKECSLLLL